MKTKRERPLYHPWMVMVNPGRTGGARQFRNPDVAYFAVTRFNLYWEQLVDKKHYHGSERHIPGHPEYADYWRERIEMFRKLCLPSMLNQRVRPHAWFVAFNQARSPDIDDVLAELHQFPWIVPFFPEDGEKWQSTELPTMLREQAQKIGKEFVCTIRFDTDDTLHPSFFAALDGAVGLGREKGLPEGDRICFNLMHGLLRTRNRVQVRLSPTNQFLAVFEPAKTARGPHDGGHNFISQKMPVIEVVTQFPLWIYNLHEGSISGYREFDSSLDAPSPSDLLREFNVITEESDGGLLSPSTSASGSAIRFERLRISANLAPDLTVDGAVYAIVTRFNLVWPDLYRRLHLDQRHLPGSPGYDDYWRRRIALFETGCLPSVLALDPRPDQWIIGFDEELTPDIEALIDRLSVHPWIRPVFVSRDGGKRWESTVVAPALELLASQNDAKLVCSMRFDSDDALHSRFIAMLDTVLQRDLKRTEPTPTPWCINPTFGLMEVDEGLGLMVDSATQFAAIVERPGGIKGPYQGNHHKIATVMPLTEVLTSRPMWLYRRYGEGINNPVSSAPHHVTLPRTHPVLREFGLDPVGVPAAVAMPAEDHADPLTELLAVAAASAANPTDIRLHETRKKLAGELRFALDVDEQLDLTEFVSGFRPVASRVLIIAARAEPERKDELRGLAGTWTERGYEVAGLSLDDSSLSSLDFEGFETHEVTIKPDGRLSTDQLNHWRLAEAAVFIHHWRPTVLLPDETVQAGRFAAALGRSFGLDVDFSHSTRSASSRKPLWVSRKRSRSVLQIPVKNGKRRPGRTSLPKRR